MPLAEVETRVARSEGQQAEHDSPNPKWPTRRYVSGARAKDGEFVVFRFYKASIQRKCDS
jgi:hypothetical protein